MEADPERLFERLARSRFRSSFRLGARDLQYVRCKGLGTIEQHAHDFVGRRLGPAFPENDGKQTPMKNHPVFLGQHATGTCCRGCLRKWHGIEMGEELSDGEIQYVVSIIMRWISGQMSGGNRSC